MEKILDAALLESLEMLNTQGVPGGVKKEVEMRFLRSERAMTMSCGAVSRRYGYDGSPSKASCFLPTKENQMDKTTMLYCASAAGSSNKMYFRRQKSRSCPYELVGKRKPLNSLLNPMGRFGTAAGVLKSSPGRTRNSDSYSESSHGANHTMPLIFDQDYSDLKFRDGLNYGKTERFPIPILSRSKSLEDLRDSPTKPRIKQVRFHLIHYDDNSNGTASSNGSNSLESPSSPTTSFLDVLKGEISIKNEIDSMSMLIEKLDVA